MIDAFILRERYIDIAFCAARWILPPARVRCFVAAFRAFAHYSADMRGDAALNTLSVMAI